MTKFDDWRNTARGLVARGVAPESIAWIDARSQTAQQQSDLFVDSEEADRASDKATSGVIAPTPPSVPKPYIDMARRVACHRSPRRWELMYRILWRIAGGEKKLLLNAADRDVHELTQFQKAVQRDAHKLKAFVRFRKTIDDSGELYVAWHRPDHYTLELTADFFARRFDVMRWVIMTPDESAFWDGDTLTWGRGMPRTAAPEGDELESLWKTYYANIFNPARIKLAAMRAEMPKKHWATMPETELIDDLVRRAPDRVETMIRNAEGGVSARPFLPEISATSGKPHSPAKAHVKATLQQLHDAAMKCEGCDLYRNATTTVFGRGIADAKLVLVGEQPGDQEDRAGEPFVGPAGQLLRDVMAEVGLDATQVYITNAVKHFKFKPSGKRRLHVKPAAREVAACRPWLEAELEAIRPEMLVCLGATAAGVILGPGFRITKQRGVIQETDYAAWTMATYHPSALLRVPDPSARQTMRAAFTADLRQAADQLRRLESSDNSERR